MKLCVMTASRVSAMLNRVLSLPTAGIICRPVLLTVCQVKIMNVTNLDPSRLMLNQPRVGAPLEVVVARGDVEIGRGVMPAAWP